MLDEGATERRRRADAWRSKTGPLLRLTLFRFESEGRPGMFAVEIYAAVLVCFCSAVDIVMLYHDHRNCAAPHFGKELEGIHDRRHGRSIEAWRIGTLAKSSFPRSGFMAGMLRPGASGRPELGVPAAAPLAAMTCMTHAEASPTTALMTVIFAFARPQATMATRRLHAYRQIPILRAASRAAPHQV